MRLCFLRSVSVLLLFSLFFNPFAGNSRGNLTEHHFAPEVTPESLISSYVTYSQLSGICFPFFLIILQNFIIVTGSKVASHTGYYKALVVPSEMITGECRKTSHLTGYQAHLYSLCLDVTIKGLT